jgi:hypothetical protein
VAPAAGALSVAGSGVAPLAGAAVAAGAADVAPAGPGVAVTTRGPPVAVNRTTVWTTVGWPAQPARAAMLAMSSMLNPNRRIVTSISSLARESD